MTIQWYPGHMHKASKDIKETLGHVDLAIEILDARLPFSSENPLLEKLRGDKPCIKILNKCDLADPGLTQIWQAYLEQEKNVKTLALSKDQSDKIKLISGLCRKLLPADRTQGKLINALIMGIPNVGKSTLINCLAGRSIAKTGNEPAVTKRQQRIEIEQDVILLDTPGMLWPKLENPHGGYRLAITGAIKDTAISHEDITCYALDYLAKNYSDYLKDRYRLQDLEGNGRDLLNTIGAKRGCLRSGGVVDADKAAKIVLTEIRSGTLGRITFETPDMVSSEVHEMEAIRQASIEKKLAKKQKRSAEINI
jgi:ribosome biogenesis GTPase A